MAFVASRTMLQGTGTSSGGSTQFVGRGEGNARAVKLVS